MRLWTGAVAAFLALDLAGCSVTASPADGLRFAAPPGWRSSPGILGFMQFWRPPNDDREVLMLFKSPKPLTAKEVFTNVQINDTLKGARIERRSAITICGDHPATFIEARGTSTHNGDERIDLVLTNIAGNGYLALYARPAGAIPNPVAESALRELCPKP
jgi:hypothetical protein